MSLDWKCDMEEEIRQRVNQNGRVIIPAAFRKALGIAVGDEIVLRIQDDELRITTQQRRIQRARRRARQYVKPGISLVNELLAERREAAKNE
jgi:AbrB family looped-hinge helix DNA binding protein